MPLGFIADVQLDVAGAGADLVSECSTLVVEDVADDNPRALGCEAARMLCSHPSGPSGDQHDTIAESFC
jgi:hypothetical protein